MCQSVHWPDSFINVHYRAHRRLIGNTARLLDRLSGIMSEKHSRTEEQKRIDHRSFVIGIGIGVVVITLYIVFYFLGLIH